MKRRIQSFVSDLDGTLLQNDFSISMENLQAIHRLEKENITFCIATGRIHHDARSICENYGISPYIISNNGTCLSDPSGRQILGRSISDRILLPICQMLASQQICFGLGSRNEYITEKNWDALLDQEVKILAIKGVQISEQYKCFVKDEMQMQKGVRYEKEINTSVLNSEKVFSISLITYDSQKLANITKELEAYPELILSISGKHNAEITHREGTKGRALLELCSVLGIKNEDVAAIGDSMNDFSMLEVAGIGIAMGNAISEIKSVSQFVSKSQKENGVSY
ncbi:MAG: Cof-type HAD-IIB family hydrolase, partial [Eubacterium aggregans]